jgi:predicted nucleic acid-binding protein
VDILADTNILLRRLHRASSQHRQTREAISKLTKDGYRLCVTSQNLIELWAVCTRPIENNGLGLSPDQAERVLARIEPSVFRLPDSDAIYPEWRRLVTAYDVRGKKSHDRETLLSWIETNEQAATGATIPSSPVRGAGKRA